MGSIVYTIAVISAAVSFALLLFYIVRLLITNMNASNFKIKQENLASMLSSLDDIIRDSVITTNQKIVNSMKRSNIFTQQDKEEAFYYSKSRILKAFNSMEPLSQYFKNVDEWINNRIEYHVRAQKKQ